MSKHVFHSIHRARLGGANRKKRTSQTGKAINNLTKPPTEKSETTKILTDNTIRMRFSILCVRRRGDNKKWIKENRLDVN